MSWNVTISGHCPDEADNPKVREALDRFLADIDGVTGYGGTCTFPNEGLTSLSHSLEETPADAEKPAETATD